MGTRVVTLSSTQLYPITPGGFAGNVLIIRNIGSATVWYGDEQVEIGGQASPLAPGEELVTSRPVNVVAPVDITAADASPGTLSDFWNTRIAIRDEDSGP